MASTTTAQLLVSSLRAATPIALHGLKRVTVTHSAKGAGNTGARKFIKEVFPAIRFFNPNLSCERVRVVDPAAKAKVAIEKATGEVSEFSVDGLRMEEISTALAKAAKS
eukprot:c56062_g1_i1.p4 GENE.c56062_g1_i1~~c56062_g1_i1.p4  ORF type:complete len:109 (-),score=19.67 c56062_g1_i1:197-523(-)